MNRQLQYQFAWTQCFANLVGWHMHPGNAKQNPTVQDTVQHCADIADIMMQHWEARFPPEGKWPQSGEP